MAETIVAPRPARRRGRMGRVALHLLLVALCASMLAPLLWMLSTALKLPQEIATPDLRLWPHAPTLRNFSDAFALDPVAAWLLNSVVTATGITLGRVLVSVPAAYAFARFRFTGRGPLFGLVVGTMIVPYVSTIIPNYLTVARLGWLNTPQAVIVPSIAFTGFYIFLLRQALLQLPDDLFEAAALDGAGGWVALWRVALPLVRPTVAVVAVLSFLNAWSLYLWPLLVLGDTGSKTLAVGIQFFISNSLGGQQWGPLMATAILATLPPLLLYIAAQRAIVSALVTSGLRG